MTIPNDPLLSFLHDEVERIERQVDERVSPPPDRRWSYRFTWQDVERARRYRSPLSIEPSLAARRSAVTNAPRPDPPDGSRRIIRIRYRPSLNAYQVTVGTDDAAGANT